MEKVRVGCNLLELAGVEPLWEVVPEILALWSLLSLLSRRWREGALMGTECACLLFDENEVMVGILVDSDHRSYVHG